VPAFVTLMLTIPQGYLIAQRLGELRNKLLDQLIAQHCHASGVLIEISAPHGCWPVLRNEITRLFLSDEFLPLMERFQVDLRINDSNRLETTERLRFGCGPVTEPS
jgi:hypothetical protein